MEDDVTKVKISKKDITNKKELPGAKLKILDENGDVVEKWTSGKKPHYIEKLPIGNYTLVEVTAPNGYEKAEKVKALAGEYGIGKFSHCAEGGRTRQESVINAVKTAAAESNIIAVHDGARPLAGRDAVRQCIKDAAIFGGAVLAVPVKDTIKEADDGMVRDTPDRRRLFMTQTPQIFEKKGFIRAVNFAIDHSLDFTDDCQMAEAVGIRINITPSDYMNIKITTPEDIVIAEALIKNGCADPDREIIKYR